MDLRSFQGGRVARLALASAAGAIFLWILFRSVSLDAIIAVASRARPASILIALLFFGLDLGVRCVRFLLILKQASSARLSLPAVSGAYIASLGISDILPLRAGDAFRLFWFQRRFQLGIGTLMSAMLIERIADVISVLLIGGGAVILSGNQASSAAAQITGTLFVLVTCAAILLLLAPGLLRRIISRWFAHFQLSQKLIGGLISIEAAARQMSRPGNLLSTLSLSLIAWIFEAAVMLSVWEGLGGRLASWLAPVLAFSFAALGTAVPSLPGHFGSFELAGFYVFRMVGADPALAAATLLATHLILWAPTALFAIIWFPLRSAPGNSGKNIEQCESSSS